MKRLSKALSAWSKTSGKPWTWRVWRSWRRLTVSRVDMLHAQAIRHIEVRALAAELAVEQRLRHAIEQRAQIAADEAKSYADQGLGTLNDSIAATSRGLIRAAASTRSEHSARIDKLEQDASQIVADYNTQLRNAEQRIEFVRSETLYEMQASQYRQPAQAVTGTQTATVARIVNSAKVDAMRPQGLRLNVGCGHIQLDGYLNVDGRALPGIDVVADATDIPFEHGAVAEIRSSHLVEHFTSHILERVLLPHWATLLKADGVLMTIAPDGAAMLRAVNDGEMTFEDFKEVLFGGQDYDGDFHYNLITPTTFTDSLVRAGFTDITEDYSGKRNGKCFEFKISARKA